MNGKSKVQEGEVISVSSIILELIENWGLLVSNYQQKIVSEHIKEYD